LSQRIHQTRHRICFTVMRTGRSALGSPPARGRARANAHHTLQRFFVGYAQWACESDRPENLRVSAMTDPHSPGRYRVNGLMVNMPQFQQAFQCKAGQPMVKEKRCRVW
jgi:predicted metalloendopeptidase